MNPKTPKDNHFYPFHVVATIHDSRTSQRMIDYRARERRFHGMKPFAEVIYLTKREELLIAQCVLELSNELNLRIAAFNPRLDRMHMLLICREDEGLEDHASPKRQNRQAV